MPMATTTANTPPACGATLAWYHFLPCHWWLWHQVHILQSHHPPQRMSGRTLHSHHGLERILFCGININWNYSAGTVNLNMPKYIPKALLKFQHPKPISPQHQLYQSAPIQYGKCEQRVAVDTSAPLTPAALKWVEDIVSTLLYSGRAVDPTLPTTGSSIAMHQSNGTHAVTTACDQPLKNVATHPNAGICYKACNMILAFTLMPHIYLNLGGKAMPQPTSIS